MYISFHTLYEQFELCVYSLSQYIHAKYLFRTLKKKPDVWRGVILKYITLEYIHLLFFKDTYSQKIQQNIPNNV